MRNKNINVGVEKQAMIYIFHGRIYSIHLFLSLSLSIASGALYVRKYFNEEARQNAKEMVADIRAEFQDILKSVDWMDEQTRQNALDKAQSMATHIAYPDELLDDRKLEEFYEGVSKKLNSI